MRSRHRHIGFVFPPSSLYLTLHGTFLGNKIWSEETINDDEAHGGRVVRFDIYARGHNNQ